MEGQSAHPDTQVLWASQVNCEEGQELRQAVTSRLMKPAEQLETHVCPSRLTTVTLFVYTCTSLHCWTQKDPASAATYWGWLVRKSYEQELQESSHIYSAV